MKSWTGFGRTGNVTIQNDAAGKLRNTCLNHLPTLLSMARLGGIMLVNDRITNG